MRIRDRHIRGRPHARAEALLARMAGSVGKRRSSRSMPGPGERSRPAKPHPPTAAGTSGVLIALAAGALAMSPPLYLRAGPPRPAAVRHQVTAESPDQQFVARLTKTQVSGITACPGSVIAYTLLLENRSDPGTGPQRATLRDPIPFDTTYVPNSVGGAGIYNAALNRIEWDGFLSPGQEVMTDFEVTLNPDVAEGTLIPNIAEATLGNQAPKVRTEARVACPTPTPTPELPALPRGLGHSSALLLNSGSAAERSAVTMTNLLSGEQLDLGSVPVPAWQVTNTLSNTSGLPDGLYSALVPDSGLDALGVGYWDASGGAMAYGASDLATEWIVPRVVKDAGGDNSVVVIVSEGEDPSAVYQIELQSNTGKVVASPQLSTNAAGSVLIDFATHEAFAGVPSPFAGRLLIRGPNAAVHSFLWNQYHHTPIYDLAGVPLGSAASELHYPSLLASWSSPDLPGSMSSYITFQNVGNRSTEVTTTYVGTSGSCAGRSYSGQPLTVFSGWSATLSLANQGVHPLPSGCTASLTASSSTADLVGFVAHIWDIGEPGGYAGASSYGAFHAAGTTRISLPLIRHDQAYGSYISVQNVGRLRSDVTVTYYDPSGASNGTRTSVPAGRGHRLFVGDIQGVQSPTTGWALVESTRPVMVVVDLLPRDAAWDLMSYQGIRSDGTVRDQRLPILPIRYPIGPTPDLTAPRPTPDLTAPPPTPDLTAPPPTPTTTTSPTPTPTPLWTLPPPEVQLPLYLPVTYSG